MSSQRQAGGAIEQKGTSDTTGTIEMVLSPEIVESIKQSLVSYLRSNPEFVKEIFSQVFTTKSGEVLLKSVGKSDAKRMIRQYIQENPGCKTSDIIMSLGLEPTLVMETLKELQEEDSILSEPVEQQ